MKSFFKKPFCIVIICILCFSFIVVMPMIKNNIALSNFSNQLNNSIPDQSILIESQNTCGHLSGNNQGTEFLSVILLESSLSLEEIQAYYQTLTFSIARPDRIGFADSDGIVELLIYSADNATFTLPYPIGTQFYRIDFEKFPLDISPSSHLYYIAIYDGKYFGIYDLRSL